MSTLAEFLPCAPAPIMRLPPSAQAADYRRRAAAARMAGNEEDALGWDERAAAAVRLARLAALHQGAMRGVV